MKKWPPLSALCAVLAAWAGHAATLPALRATRLSLAGTADDLSQIPTNTEIKEKWDKMDEFLKVMFTIACKWKHGKDVNGLTAEAIQNKKVTGAGAKDFKAGVQAENLKKLTQACGAIVAKGEKDCRQGCADRWGVALGDRQLCDDKCVTVYSKFETSCVGKAENLEKVYKMKLQMSDSRKRCHEGFCKEFPTVWMKADAASMEAEVDSSCQARCTEDNIKARCENKWQLELDFVRVSLRNKCFSDSTVVKTCFDGKKATASTDFDTCNSDGAGKCGTQFDECKTKGSADTDTKAMEFCTERKKMCSKQVQDSCVATHKAALEGAQTACEKEGAEDLAKCEDDALTAKQAEVVAACQSELGPKCTDECRKKCDSAKMNECLHNLASESDPAQEFCEDFWRLLHESSEVDPITGNPIVLLSSSSA